MMTDGLAQFFATYGLPALAFILAAGQFGVPLPTSILLLTAGALQASGDLAFWPLVFSGIAGAMVGDHAGYLVGRLAGPFIERKTASSPRFAASMAKADAFMAKRGTTGVFLTRWLISPIGPLVNVAAGLSRLPAGRFALADLAGEAIWVTGYVSIGSAFASQIGTIADLLANAGWTIGAVVLTGLLGMRLWKASQRSRVAARAIRR